MQQILIRIDKETVKKVESLTHNKSEFIRQAITEKLEKVEDKNSKNNIKILTKLTEINDVNEDIEKDMFLLNKRLIKQNKLLEVLLEELLKNSFYTIHNLGMDKAKDASNEVKRLTNEMLVNIKDKLNSEM